MTLMRTHLSTKAHPVTFCWCYEMLPFFLATLTIYHKVWRVDKGDQMWQECMMCPHPSINYLLSFIRKVKHHYIYKVVSPVENTQLQPAFASAVSTYSPGSSMTFRPAGLSRDPHGIE